MFSPERREKSSGTLGKSLLSAGRREKRRRRLKTSALDKINYFYMFFEMSVTFDQHFVFWERFFAYVCRGILNLCRVSGETPQALEDLGFGQNN